MKLDSISSKLELSESSSTDIKLSNRKEDIAVLIGLVTKGLYSKPLESCVREIISNARDAHREANINKPIEVYIDCTNKIMTIKDYGKGLSPEQFENIYLYLARSTKRDTNDLTGGFGIGSKSPFGISDNFNVVSYTNGIKRLYSLNIIDGTFKAFLVSETKSNEPSGVEIICSYSGAKSGSDDEIYTNSDMITSLFLATAGMKEKVNIVFERDGSRIQFMQSDLWNLKTESGLCIINHNKKLIQKLHRTIEFSSYETPNVLLCVDGLLYAKESVNGFPCSSMLLSFQREIIHRSYSISELSRKEKDLITLSIPVNINDISISSNREGITGSKIDEKKLVIQILRNIKKDFIDTYITKDKEDNETVTKSNLIKILKDKNKDIKWLIFKNAQNSLFDEYSRTREANDSTITFSNVVRESKIVPTQLIDNIRLPLIVFNANQIRTFQMIIPNLVITMDPGRRRSSLISSDILAEIIQHEPTGKKKTFSISAGITSVKTFSKDHCISMNANGLGISTLIKWLSRLGPVGFRAARISNSSNTYSPRVDRTDYKYHTSKNAMIIKNKGVLNLCSTLRLYKDKAELRYKDEINVNLSSVIGLTSPCNLVSLNTFINSKDPIALSLNLSKYSYLYMNSMIRDKYRNFMYHNDDLNEFTQINEMLNNIKLNLGKKLFRMLVNKRDVIMLYKPLDEIRKTLIESELKIRKITKIENLDVLYNIDGKYDMLSNIAGDQEHSSPNEKLDSLIDKNNTYIKQLRDITTVVNKDSDLSIISSDLVTLSS